MNGKPACGAINPDYPDEYACTEPVGHARVQPPDGGEPVDHAAAEAGAYWNERPMPMTMTGTAAHVDPRREQLVAECIELLTLLMKRIDAGERPDLKPARGEVAEALALALTLT